jgi:hypothetical protein
MVRIRRAAGEYADVLFYRATSFAKLYEHTGQMAGRWQDLAAFVRWAGSAEDLRDLFLACDLVQGEHETLYDWEEINGWLYDRADRERKRKRKERAALAAKERREERQRAQRAQRRKVTQSGGREGGREGGEDRRGRPRTVHGREKTQIRSGKQGRKPQ